MFNRIDHHANCFTELDQWQIISIRGRDTKSYLQGQLTANIHLLMDRHWLFAAHCNTQGKVVSNMLIYQIGNQLYYIQRRSVTNRQLNELKKYAVFSDVTIDQSHYGLIGLSGAAAPHWVAQSGFTLSDNQNSVDCRDEIVIIRLEKPVVRFIISAPPDKIALLKSALISHQFNYCAENCWIQQEIEAGYPILDQENTEHYLPQAINLDKLEAISFSKGCYRGQEMVAKAAYRGINKHALFRLIGRSLVTPRPGENLEMALNDRWRETGRILAVVNHANNQLTIQAVLNRNIALDTTFRLKSDPAARLFIQT